MVQHGKLSENGSFQHFNLSGVAGAAHFPFKALAALKEVDHVEPDFLHSLSGLGGLTVVKLLIGLVKLLGEGLEFLAGGGTAAPDLAQQLIRKEEVQRIQKVLHDISEPYKEVFMWRVFAQLSFKQIGSIFGKNENWACVTYHRARKMILKRLEEMEK